jgi:hypothetical protein
MRGASRGVAIEEPRRVNKVRRFTVAGGGIAFLHYWVLANRPGKGSLQVDKKKLQVNKRKLQVNKRKLQVDKRLALPAIELHPPP